MSQTATEDQSYNDIENNEAEDGDAGDNDADGGAIGYNSGVVVNVADDE